MENSCTCDDSDEEMINEFTSHTWKEDLTLIVEGKHMYVAKAILGTVSPVFDKMFSNDFAEKDKAEIELPGKKFEDVHEFLTCFYPGQDNEVSEDNVDQVLPLAHEYQITNLISDCEQVLDARVCKSDVFKTLYMAHIYNLPELLEKCYTLASETTHNNVAMCTILPDDVKSKIYERMACSNERLLNKEKSKVLDLTRQIKVFRTIAQYNVTEKAPYGQFLHETDISQMDSTTLSVSIPKAQLMTTRTKIQGTLFSSVVKIRLSSKSVKFSLAAAIVQDCQVDLTTRVVVQNEHTLRKSYTNKFKLVFRNKTKETCRLFLGDVLEAFNHNTKFVILLIAKRQRIALKHSHP